MANSRQPTIRWHKSGCWFVRWGGRDHYLSADKAAAEKLFLDPASDHPGSLAAWYNWRSSKPQPTRAPRRVRVVDVVEQFCARYESQGRVAASRYHRKHLNRFTHALGQLFADELATDILAAFSVSMHELRFPGPDHRALSPSTINKDIKAVRGFVRWACDLELCRPLRERRLELLPERQAEPQDVPLATLHDGVRLAVRADPRVAVALRLHYMTAARPSELIRLLWRQGSFVPMPPGASTTTDVDADRCVFRLDDNKTTHRIGLPRYLVLSPQALAVFDQTRLETRKGVRTPVHAETGRAFWKTPGGYAQSLRDDDKVAAPFPTSVVRPSAATHLHYQGVPRATVDRALGHIPRGAGRNYIREDWSQLLAAVGRLSL